MFGLGDDKSDLHMHTPYQPLTDPTSGQPLCRAISQYPVLVHHKSFFLV